MRKILILLAFCANAMAGDLPDLGEPTLGRYELSKGQIVAETGFVALMYVDYRQTMDIKSFCSRRQALAIGSGAGSGGAAANDETCGLHETNPFLGRHPSDAKIRNYFAGATLAHVAIAKALPTEYRPYWQGAGILVQVVTVIKNRRMGLSVNF